MSMAEREKQDARRSNAQSWASKEDSLFASKVVKFPDGVKAIKLKPPTMNIDVIEYVCGPGNPECDEGLLHFELSYYVHRVPAPDGNTAYPCLWANHKKACPICDWMRDQYGKTEPQLLKDMRPNHRHLMNAIDLGSRDQKIEILDVNHYNRGSGFGEQLKAAIKAVPQFASFAQYDGGHTLVLTVSEMFMGQGKKYNAATRIDFVARSRPYGEGILKHVHNLEACLIPYEYDQLRGLFLQQGPVMATAPAAVSAPPPQGQYSREAPRDYRSPPVQQPPYEREAPRYDAPPPPPVQQSYVPARTYEPPQALPQVPPQQPPAKREPTAADYGLVLGDHVEHQRFGMCEIVRISPDGTLLTLEDSNSMEYRAIGPHEVKKMVRGPSAPAASPPAAPAQRETPPAYTPPPPPAYVPPVQAPPAAPTQYARHDDDFDRRPPAQRPAQDPRRRDD